MNHDSRPTPPVHHRPLWIGAALFLVVLAVFLPAVNHGYIPYDDPTYIYQNPHVTGGLSWANVRWAFTSIEASNWHPLTWLSHQLDCTLFGAGAGGNHLTSALLHALSTLLLFLALLRATGALWRSAMVAALFGLHPLHVESVAWAAERKDALSTVFWMLVLLVYAQRATRLREGRSGTAHYGLALVLFALGLMAKPMLVTLPCVLLLWDFWPLGRWTDAATRARGWLVLEKLPFFALSAASCAITLYAQRHGGTVASLEDFTPAVRLGNALIAYCLYLGKCVLPTGLAVFYPNFARQPPLWAFGLAAALLVAITVLVVRLARSRGYLLVGWLWFLGTLVPVIGFVQVGGQLLADRYSYVPLIGIFVMAVWAIADFAPAWPHRARILAIGAGALLATLAVLTTRQLRFWQTPVTLFRHAAAVTENNWVAHYNLSIALRATDPQAAQAELHETLRIVADFAESYDREGVALAQTPASRGAAIEKFRTAIRIMRTLPDPHYHLALALAETPGRTDEAIAEFRIVVQLDPSLADAHFRLASLLSSTPGHTDEAIAEYQAALAVRSDWVEAHYRLGLLLAAIPWRSGDALLQFEEAVRLKPDFAAARAMAEKLRKE